MRKGKKKELYLKNEAALDEFVIQSATDDLRLEDAANQVIEGAKLRELSFKSLRYRKVFSRMQRRGDPRVLEAVVQQAGLIPEMLLDADEIAEELEKTQGYLEQALPGDACR